MDILILIADFAVTFVNSWTYLSFVIYRHEAKVIPFYINIRGFINTCFSRKKNYSTSLIDFTKLYIRCDQLL